MAIEEVPAAGTPKERVGAKEVVALVIVEVVAEVVIAVVVVVDIPKVNVDGVVVVPDVTPKLKVGAADTVPAEGNVRPVLVFGAPTLKAVVPNVGVFELPKVPNFGADVFVEVAPKVGTDALVVVVPKVGASVLVLDVPNVKPVVPAVVVGLSPNPVPKAGVCI